MRAVTAYHFVGERLRDGRPVPKDGEWLVHEGECEMCASGLHASRHPFDALMYAPGSTLCRVKCRGIEDEHEDKFVCRERMIVARFDATVMLRAFARKCALDVIHLWDAPDVVVRYLKTGDEELRAEAQVAACAAACAAARSEEWDAACTAACAAERSEEWAEAPDAAWGAAVKKQRTRFARMVNSEFKRVAA